MDLDEKIAEQVAHLPTALKPLLDAELAAGNAIKDVEIGRGEDAGKVALVLERPFHWPSLVPPPGVRFRESERKFGRIFEFVTEDDRFSLLTVRFKEIVLQKITGPANPTEEHIARSQERQKEEAARLAERKKELEAEAAAGPILTKFRRGHPGRSAAAQKFLGSMNMTYEMWHDGEGYDLEALDEIPETECEEIEEILIDHRPRDWRDIEALARFDSPQARKAIEEALKDSDPKVRQEAMEHAPEKVNPAARERLLIKTLNNSGLYDGLSDAIDEVEEFHPPKVIDALLRGALKRDGEAAVHFAAMLFFLHGKAKEPFDWDHRPFFLKFLTPDRAERVALFRELCATIGVDPKKYLR